MTAATQRVLEPVGPTFFAYASRKLHNRTFSEDERYQAEQKAKQVVEEEKVDFEYEDVDLDTVNTDPTNWKQQDNYAVLGLTKLRYKATEEQIKKAHRRMVLLHHPDKKADKNDDAFFKCIAKAYDTLMNPVTRRQYDSVDFGMAELDEDVPTAKTPGDFYELWAPVFEREARFSNKQPVPQLVTSDPADKEAVEGFYDFWYNFDSWRTFEWLDKEGAEGADNRDDKRYQEKKNRAQRAQLKKEDNARLRKIIDTCLSVDPRIALIRAEEKKRRNAKKDAKAAAEKAAAEEKARKAEEERLAKEKAEQDAKDAANAAKKDKEAIKRAVKKEKKTVKQLFQANNYGLAGEPATPEQMSTQLALLDEVLVKNKMLPNLEALRKSLEQGQADGKFAEVFAAAAAQ